MDDDTSAMQPFFHSLFLKPPSIPKRPSSSSFFWPPFVGLALHRALALHGLFFSSLNQQSSPSFCGLQMPSLLYSCFPWPYFVDLGSFGMIHHHPSTVPIIAIFFSSSFPKLWLSAVSFLLGLFLFSSFYAFFERWCLRNQVPPRQALSHSSPSPPSSYADIYFNCILSDFFHYLTSPVSFVSHNLQLSESQHTPLPSQQPFKKGDFFFCYF